MSLCDICGKEEPISHHISYIPPVTKLVYRSCHFKIHRTNQYPELTPPYCNDTTIFVSNKTKKKLAKLKIIPREPYEDVIKRLLEG